MTSSWPTMEGDQPDQHMDLLTSIAQLDTRVRGLERSFRRSLDRAEALESRINMQLHRARLESAIVDVLELAWRTHRPSASFIYQAFTGFFHEAIDLIIRWAGTGTGARSKDNLLSTGIGAKSPKSNDLKDDSNSTDNSKDTPNPRQRLNRGDSPYDVLIDILGSAESDDFINQAQFVRPISTHFCIDPKDFPVLIQLSKVICYSPRTVVSRQAAALRGMTGMTQKEAHPPVSTLRSILFDKNAVVEYPAVWRVAQALVAHALWKHGQTFGLEKDVLEASRTDTVKHHTDGDDNGSESSSALAAEYTEKSSIGELPVKRSWSQAESIDFCADLDDDSNSLRKARSSEQLREANILL